MAEASLLKPFEERAAKAEERLARLEAALDGLGGLDGGGLREGRDFSGEGRLLSSLKELRGHLERAQEEQRETIRQKDEAVKERERLEIENKKLQYRIVHLVRALKEGDEKIEKLSKEK